MAERLVSVGNEFAVKFYAETVKFTVKEIRHAKLEGLPTNFTHFEVTTNSKISRVGVGGKEEESNSGKKRDREGRIELMDIGGAELVVKEMQISIRLVLESPGPKELRGILLYGNNGTGKSWLVRGICSYFKLHMIMYQNSSLPRFTRNDHVTVCKTLREAFAEAARRAPSAVIIENLDIADMMGDESDFTSAPSFVTSLKAQFEKLESLPLPARIVVLATTSDLDSVDPGLRSPSLFARELEVPIPTVLGRQDILNRIMKKMKHRVEGKELKQIAEHTHGFVGADLRALCHESALLALRVRNDEFFDLQDMESSLKIVRPSAMKGYTIQVPNVKWSDIGGQEELKFKLKQGIEWPIKHPEAFTRMGITPPKGFLMYGPPGCSKTMIAKAIATESGLNFISVKGSEIFSKWVGESEKAIQSLFRKAREVAPSILFFDEIDSMGGERGSSSSGGSSVNERVLSQLLVEIDGIESLRDVTIVAATNRPEMIDLALIRPGRLDRIIYVPLPNAATRRDIFRIRFTKMPVDSNVDVEKLVTLTKGYSGAEITSLCQEAALKALEEDICSNLIRQVHFNQALNIVKPRISKEQIDLYENYEKGRAMS